MQHCLKFGNTQPRPHFPSSSNMPTINVARSESRHSVLKRLGATAIPYVIKFN